MFASLENSYIPMWFTYTNC